jgi:hypothetical protein
MVLKLIHVDCWSDIQITTAKQINAIVVPVALKVA